MKDWTLKSKYTDNLIPEVCYMLKESFYIGDPNKPLDFQNPDLNIPLELPPMPRVSTTQVTIKEAQGHEEALAAYYKSILELKEKYKKSYSELVTYFWMRLWLYNPAEEIYLSFPWYDHLYDFKNFFTIFGKNELGNIYMDVDQSWSFDIFADDSFYYFKQANPDVQPEYVLVNVKVNKSSFKNRMLEFEDNLEAQIKKLSQLVGLDLWTNNPSYLENKR